MQILVNFSFTFEVFSPGEIQLTIMNITTLLTKKSLLICKYNLENDRVFKKIEYSKSTFVPKNVKPKKC